MNNDINIICLAFKKSVRRFNISRHGNMSTYCMSFMIQLVVCATAFPQYFHIFTATMFGVNPSNIILVHDDLDKALGKFSFKNGGSAG